MVNKKQGALTGATAQVVALAYQASDLRNYLEFLLYGPSDVNTLGPTGETPLTFEDVFFENWLTNPDSNDADPVSSPKYEFVGLCIGETYKKVEGEYLRNGTRGEFNLNFMAIFKRLVVDGDLDYSYEARLIKFPAPIPHNLGSRTEVISPNWFGNYSGRRLEFSSYLDALDFQDDVPSFSFALFPIKSLLNLTAHNNRTIFLSGTLIEFGGGHFDYDYEEYFTLKLEASPEPFSAIAEKSSVGGGEQEQTSTEDTPSPEGEEDTTENEVGVPAFMIGAPCPPHWRLMQG